jgi:transcriptional regulator with XRE-family HTH domain
MVAVAKRKQIDPDYGARLRALREKAGLSQSALGEMVGIASNSIARIERSESEPTWGLARRLADALNTSLDSFRHPDQPDDQPDADEPPARPVGKRK